MSDASLKVDAKTIDDFEASLNQVKPQIGSYDGILAILKLIGSRGNEAFPHRTYNALKRFFRKDKPYFLGVTGEKIRFIGDWQDVYSVHWHLSPHREADLLGFLRANGTRLPGAFLDVGANMGLVSASIAKDLKCKIIAFEPLHGTATRAACTFALNHLTNVNLVPIAVGDQNCEISFFSPVSQCDMASAYQNQAITELQLPMVETRVMSYTLDWLYQQGIFDKIGFIKIDVEGNEYNVIKGAAETLKRDRPDILFEYNPKIAPDAGWSLEDICARIKEAGPYSFQIMSEGRLLPFSPAPDDQEYVNVYCKCME